MSLRNINTRDSAGGEWGISGGLPITLAEDSDVRGIFGGLNVNQSESILEVTHLYDINQSLTDQLTASGGTVAWSGSTDTPYAELDVTTTVGSRAVHQTLQHATYQPGKGQLVKMTTDFSAVVAGVKAKAGYFDNRTDRGGVGGNGVFLEKDIAGDFQIVLRSSVTGLQVDTAIPRASWDDPMDGTGPSGLTLDLDTRQVFLIGIQWLSVGDAYIGFEVGKTQVWAHRIPNLNTGTGPYMASACLPVRWEIEQVSGTNISTLRAICASVESQGGHSPSGKQCWSKNATGVSSSSAALIPLVSVRKASGYEPITLIPLGVSVLADQNLEWALVANGTLTGATWGLTPSTFSPIEYDNGATAITGGCQLDGGFVEKNGAIFLPSEQIKKVLGMFLDGTSEIITLCVRATSVTATVYGGIKTIHLY